MDKEKITRSSKKRKQEKGSALEGGKSPFEHWHNPHEVFAVLTLSARQEKPLGRPGFLVASRGPLENYSETELDRPISKLFEVE